MTKPTIQANLCRKQYLKVASPKSGHGGGKGERPKKTEREMSNEKKREFVTAAGRQNDVIAKLSKAVYAEGGCDEDILRIVSSGKLCREIAKLLVGSAATEILAEMIAACGFRYVNPDINERNFPPAGLAVDVADMLTVSQEDLGGSNMTTAEIETAIDSKGYCRATLVELLAYAKAKWNGRDLVFALGSSWVGPHGNRCVPYLYGIVGGRKLYLFWGNPEYRWDSHCLFLVVRK